jgi:hypothetical protein
MVQRVKVPSRKRRTQNRGAAPNLFVEELAAALSSPRSIEALVAVVPGTSPQGF